MAVFFCDSSALVKRYINETGSVWLTGIIDPAAGNRVYIAGITIVEIVSALTRQERGLRLSANDAAAALARFDHDWRHEFSIVGVSAALLQGAAILARKYGLRGYDAVQLAAALQTQARRRKRRLSAITLLSSDNALNGAAIMEGLTADDPNNH